MFIGAINERRQEIISELGDDVRCPIDIWGDERNQMYSNSAVCLNMHYYDKNSIHEDVRVFPLLVNGCCVVSEDGESTERLDQLKDMMIITPYNKLADTTKAVLNGEIPPPENIKEKARSMTMAASLLDSLPIWGPPASGLLEIVAVVLVFNDVTWLQYSIRSILRHVKQVLVLVGSMSFYGQSGDVSAVRRVIDSIDDRFGKIRMVMLHGMDEVNQRKLAMRMIESKYPSAWIMFVDSFEVWDHQNIQRLIETATIGVNKDDKIKAFTCSSITYWKSTYFCIDPPVNHHPVVLIKNTVELEEGRKCILESGQVHRCNDVLVHNLGYARTSGDMIKKLNNIPFSNISKEWHLMKWSAWDKDRSIEDLHPIQPEAFKRAVPISKQEGKNLQRILMQ